MLNYFVNHNLEFATRASVDVILLHSIIISADPNLELREEGGGGGEGGGFVLLGLLVFLRSVIFSFCNQNKPGVGKRKLP